MSLDLSSSKPVSEALMAFQRLDLDQHFQGPFDPWPFLKRLLLEEASKTPAYLDYLARHGRSLSEVDSPEAFRALPLMTKPDYIAAYPLSSRVPGGDLSSLNRLAVSSGSTGEPTLWPRSEDLEFPIAVRFEQVFKDAFQADRRKTLAVVCFALGNWVGGLFTTSCLWHLTRKGYPMTVATPGNQIPEILRVIQALGPEYDQVVLLGYPPFIRDVVDQGILGGMDWASLSIRMVFAGEVFSEEWRAALSERAGGISPHQHTASLYGTADGGVLGNETPYSICIRRHLSQHPELQRQLFGESRLPTLVQYDPRDRYFEVVDETLVLSGRNGVPLIRYHIKDRGGLIPFDEMNAFLKRNGALEPILQQMDGNGAPRPLPFVYVFGRSDFTISFYGANVFPENVSVGLERIDLMEKLSGKFILEAEEGGEEGPRLRVTVELRQGISPDSGLEADVAAAILNELLRLNSEFRNYVPQNRQRPKVILKPFADPQDFPTGVKHRYTRKIQKGNAG